MQKGIFMRMMKLLRISFCMILMAQIGGLHALPIDLDEYQGLVSDELSYRVGDPITVVVVQSFVAEKESEKGLDTDLRLSGGVDYDGGNKNAGMGLGTARDRSGYLRTSGQVKTVVTARITSLIENGMYGIEGHHKTTVNGEVQTVAIMGKIRSSDILQDNTIYSHKIADATIEIDGIGEISDTKKKNIFVTVFSWLGLL